MCCPKVSSGTMDPADFRGGRRRLRDLIRRRRWPLPTSRHGSPALDRSVFKNMPPRLPRETVTITSVLPTATRRPSPSDHRVGVSDYVYEATSRFTGVTACSFAGGKLTTPCYQDAASSCYQGVRTTPRTGLQPARLTVVTANGQTPVYVRSEIVGCIEGRNASSELSG